MFTLGTSIPIHALPVFLVTSSFKSNVITEWTPYWEPIEVLHGCGVELHILFTYRASEMLNALSGWWFITYT